MDAEPRVWDTQSLHQIPEMTVSFAWFYHQFCLVTFSDNRHSCGVKGVLDRILKEVSASPFLLSFVYKKYLAHGTIYLQNPLMWLVV